MSRIQRLAVAAAATVVAGFAAGGSAAQTPELSVVCKSNRIVLPTNGVELAFETGGLCSDLARATQKSAQGKKLSDKEAERVKLVTWLDANLAAGDRVNLDRFGRGTLIRCSSDPAASLAPKVAPRIGDGTYEMHLLLELPAGSGGCPG